MTLTSSNFQHIITIPFSLILSYLGLPNFHLALEEVICLHNVRIHKGDWYGIVHVIIGRNNVNGELWAMRETKPLQSSKTMICANALRDEKTTIQTFAEYGLRFDIEENFLDDQSKGWNIQRSMIRDIRALSHLWFILSYSNPLR